jgi:hypothetical protein
VSRESGQATVEWAGLVLLAALALGAFAALVPAVDGRSLGAAFAHRLVCAARGGCSDGQELLARAYGESDAALVRRHAPNLVYEPGERQIPVDWRRCRRSRCAEAPDDPDLDVHRSDRGARATVFTRVLRRGGRVYLQYWLYYPDSNSAVAGSDELWEKRHLIPLVGLALSTLGDYPGYHRDDWESYFVRIEPDGRVSARASSHGHWQGCKERDCRGEWTAASGWTRVSRGSHAGHLPMGAEPRQGAGQAGGGRGRLPGFAPVEMRRFPLVPGLDLRERTTTAEALRLIPLETHGRRGYRPLDPGIKPPWRKDAFVDPESEGS